MHCRKNLPSTRGAASLSTMTWLVPVHADIPLQEVIFMDETDPMLSPMKAKGIGELGLGGDRERDLQHDWHSDQTIIRSRSTN